MRRLSMIRFFAMFMIMALSVNAGKGGDSKKKGDNDKAKTQTVALSGTIVMQQRGITKTYRILGKKSYIIARSVQGKVLQYEGEIVTVYGTAINGKIVKINGVVKGAAEVADKEK